MTISLILIGIAFYFLARVTNWFTIRLVQFTPCQIPLKQDSGSVIKQVVDDTDDTLITAIVEHRKPLLLEATCSLTKLHNEFKDSRYKPHFKDYRDSYQVMIFGNHTITLNAKAPELYDRLTEIDKVLNSKFKPASIKMGQLTMPNLIEQVRIGSHHEYFKWNEETRSLDIIYKYKAGYHHRVVEDTNTVYHDCLCGIDWLKAHEHDVIPEPTIDIIVNDKTFHVNGNYKKGLIKEYMSAYITKARIGRKVVNLNVGIADKV